MRQYFAILFIIVICSSWSLKKGIVSDKETIKKLVLQSKAVYEKMDSYAIGFTYTLYNTPVSNDFSERYKGVSVKNGVNYYSKVNQTEFIQIGKSYVKIDNENKLVNILESEPTKKTPFDDISTFLKNYNKFKITENSNQWICTLTAPEVTFTPYGKIIIYINKIDSTIEQQEFFLLYRNDYKDKLGKTKTANPRLVVKVEYLNKDTSEFVEKLKIDYYLLKNGSKVKLSKRYQNYQIVD